MRPQGQACRGSFLLRDPAVAQPGNLGGPSPRWFCLWPLGPGTPSFRTLCVVHFLLRVLPTWTGFCPPPCCLSGAPQRNQFSSCLAAWLLPIRLGWIYFLSSSSLGAGSLAGHCEASSWPRSAFPQQPAAWKSRTDPRQHREARLRGCPMLRTSRGGRFLETHFTEEEREAQSGERRAHNPSRGQRAGCGASLT